ncbi:MAG: MoaD/ThiS family protein [Betaproteobacteria bacterium]|nr:MoaD/ThiS family protein [Betaproteobacteria bacterium]
MIRILYFAGLRETFGIEVEDMALPAPPTVTQLIDQLRQRGTPWSDSLAPGRRWRVAVNHEMSPLDQVLADGDEVAFFPPVTGG